MKHILICILLLVGLNINAQSSSNSTRTDYEVKSQCYKILQNGAYFYKCHKILEKNEKLVFSRNTFIVSIECMEDLGFNVPKYDVVFSGEPKMTIYSNRLCVFNPQNNGQEMVYGGNDFFSYNKEAYMVNPLSKIKVVYLIFIEKKEIK